MEQLNTLQSETSRLQMQEEHLVKEIKMLEQKLSEATVCSCMKETGQLYKTVDPSTAVPEVISLESVKLEQAAPLVELSTKEIEPVVEESQLTPPQLLQQWQQRLEVLEKENQNLQV